MLTVITCLFTLLGHCDTYIPHVSSNCPLTNHCPASTHTNVTSNASGKGQRCYGFLMTCRRSMARSYKQTVNLVTGTLNFYPFYPNLYHVSGNKIKALFVCCILSQLMSKWKHGNSLSIKKNTSSLRSLQIYVFGIVNHHNHFYHCIPQHFPY